jgi:hypothetical protein
MKPMAHPSVLLRRSVLLLSAATLFTSLFAALFAALPASADTPPFDLKGPRLQVKVTRAGQTLPITQVPNLAVGDVLWIHPDFPPGEAAHYLIVAAFLRGATNPPPEDWFFKGETWDKKFTGLTVTIPEGAQQVLVFFAPETGGDYRTLLNAVRGSPGSFVRASQDLNQASLDRTRLDVYLAAVRAANASGPAQLKTVTPLLARTLAINVDPKCLQKDSEQQESCLLGNQDNLILDDGHSNSMVNALTSGPSSDLALQASYTSRANSGFYSPYVTSVMDIAKILDSLHTAQYKYIPALATQNGNAIELKLNAPPSFHNPKSVLVVALPAVESAQPPPLRAVDQNQVFCAAKPDLLLPAEGAPLVFSTGYARNLVLNVKAGGKTVPLPLKPDAAKGGFLVDTKPLAGVKLGASLEAEVSGSWGFAPIHGPDFHLQGVREQMWRIPKADVDSLVVGQEGTLHLEADDATCVDSIQFRNPAGVETKAVWKLLKPDQIEIKVPLKDEHPGAMLLVVKQAGLDKPQLVPVRTFSEIGHLESFTIHAGDSAGLLKGSRLDQVASIEVDGAKFTPAKSSDSQGPASGQMNDGLAMQTDNAAVAKKFAAGQQFQGQATLTDGRTAQVQATIDASRPSVTLLGKNIQPASNGPPSTIQLANQDEMPQSSKLVFSLKAQSPPRFSREEKIEVATADGSYSATLDMGDGTLTLQDAHTALATLDPSKAFGASAFGPLHFRVVGADGAAGDWQPLVTLVRLPDFQKVQCSSDASQPCHLAGSGLYLVDAVAADAQFTSPTQVPDGFPGGELSVPHPQGGQLFVKLRDDPSVINPVTVTVETAPGSRHSRHAAHAASTQSAPDQPPAQTPPPPASPDQGAVAPTQTATPPANPGQPPPTPPASNSPQPPAPQPQTQPATPPATNSQQPSAPSGSPTTQPAQPQN